MINRVVLVGRLGQDPELRKSTSGNSIAHFTLAVNSRNKDANGKILPCWVPCVAFSQQAENVAKSVRKGSLVGIDGRLNQNSYTRQDGTKVSVLEVICDSVQFLDKKTDGNDITNAVFDDTPAVSEDDLSGNNTDKLDLPSDDLPF